MTPERIKRRINRRGALQAGLGGIAALGAFPIVTLEEKRAMADSMSPETVVYVSNAGSRDIHVLSMDRATGALSPIEKKEVPGSDKSPSSLPMALSSDKRFLYAQLRGEPYPVSAFAIDPASGKLTLLGTTPLIDQMAYLNVDKSGKHLLGASYVGAKIASYPIDAKGGVEAKGTQIIETQPKAHCVLIDGANRHVYVPVLSADHVMQFAFDPASGRLTPSDPPVVITKAGAGPRHFTIHPNGKWGYLLTETTATIGAYAIDPAKGTLREIAFVETGDHNGKDSAFASDIHVTPDGRYLYGAVRTTSTLHGYKIDPDKGTLTAIGKWPTEKTPRGFDIDPRGKFLLSVGMDSAGMTVHAIDPNSGALTAKHQVPMGMQPNWVEIVDLKG
ncbi:MAG: lactonase family protein [Alphaproteobacteria bacterium]|nr:lactonase family protein [Alphaproteobacteria bacterium]MBV8411509.1 lactonase family protein [Alphaproteobacteria bacterium]